MELLLFEPWNYKYGSKERENCWERISESLNQLTDMPFKVRKNRSRPLSDIRKNIKNKNGKKTGKVGSIQKSQNLTLLWQM